MSSRDVSRVKKITGQVYMEFCIRDRDIRTFGTLALTTVYKIIAFPSRKYCKVDWGVIMFCVISVCVIIKQIQLILLDINIMPHKNKKQINEVNEKMLG